MYDLLRNQRKYKQGDEWVDDPNDADISTFRECYESTKDIKKKVLFIVL